MYACVPTLLCPAGLAKPETGPSQTRGLYIPFSFLLRYLSTYHSSSVFLSPLLSLIPPNLLSHPFSLSISFSFHTLLIFFNNILNPTLHFLGLSPFFLPRPHYLFFLLSHFQPHTYFSKFFQSFKKLHCVCSYSNTSQSCNCVLAYCTINQNVPPFSCIAFHSVILQSFLMSLAAAVIHLYGGPLLIKLLCLHMLSMLYDRKMKYSQKASQLFCD